MQKRKDDIPFLTEYFLKKYSLIYRKNLPGIDENTLELLIKWHWPGNIRELENTIEFSVIRAKKEIYVSVLSQKEFAGMLYV